MINTYDELMRVLQSVGKTIADITAIKLAEEDMNGDYDDMIVLCNSVDTIGNMQKHTYDNGFGGQQLFGLVLFNDNTWLSRGEYDGAEWWQYNSPPTAADIDALYIK